MIFQQQLAHLRVHGVSSISIHNKSPGRWKVSSEALSAPVLVSPALPGFLYVFRVRAKTRNTAKPVSWQKTWFQCWNGVALNSMKPWRHSDLNLTLEYWETKLWIPADESKDIVATSRQSLRCSHNEMVVIQHSYLPIENLICVGQVPTKSQALLSHIDANLA